MHTITVREWQKGNHESRRIAGNTKHNREHIKTKLSNINNYTSDYYMLTRWLFSWITPRKERANGY